MNQIKNSNIELLRIISMIMIIALHILNQGLFLSNSVLLSSKYNVLWSVEIAFYCAVNLFALITGYIYVKKEKVSLRSLFLLWLQVVFYTLGIFFIFLIISPEVLTIKDFIKSCFPILFNQYWYVTAYFGMYLFIPYINRLIKSFSKKEFKKLLFILVIVFSIIPTIVPTDIFSINYGYSTAWLVVMYFIGAYIGRFKEEFLKISKLKSFIIYLLSVGFVVGFKLTMETATLKILGKPILGDYILSYTSIFIVISSVALFIFILNLKINKKLVKLINNTGKLSFGVYLIHTNPLFFSLVWPKLFSKFVNLNLTKTLCVIVCMAILVFIIGITIEWFRTKLFKILKINKIINKI